MIQIAARARRQDLEDRSRGRSSGRTATRVRRRQRRRVPAADAARSSPPRRAHTGGPIAGHASSIPTAPAGGFATHICDVEVDPETGKVDGPALHRRPGRRQGDPPELRRGPDPGRRRAGHRLGAQRGVHLRRQRARMENPGFLDYRMPRRSDLPMIEPVIVEVPNAKHPYGVRGVGEVPIVPPLAAVANAIRNAIGPAPDRPADVAAEGAGGAGAGGRLGQIATLLCQQSPIADWRSGSNAIRCRCEALAVRRRPPVRRRRRVGLRPTTHGSAHLGRSTLMS